MKTVAFALQKGGTGKTSISVSVAAELAKKSKTLLVDADPQGNSSGWIFPEIEWEFADVLMGKCDVQTAAVETQIKNLWILPTAGLDGSLRTYSDTVAINKPRSVIKLMPQIEAMGFEYVIFDTSPAFNALEKSVFLAVEEVIAVLQLDVFSADGLQTFINSLTTLKDDFDSENPYINKLILNSHDKRIAHQEDILSDYEKVKGFKTFLIPVDQAFKNAQSQGIPIQAYSGTKDETLKTIQTIARSIK